MTKADQEIARRFTERYRAGPAEVSRQVELAVIGGDWGANGYTTMAQAGLLASKLGLHPGVRLLDLGAGRGWPGLYLAAASGCQVVLADVPLEGLRTAAARARSERLADRAGLALASAPALPFGPAAFDAIVHTDVLCWLRPKLSVLRACRRILRPSGRMAFFTIHPVTGLRPAQRRRASRDGPPAVAAGRPYTQLLKAAGFTNVTETDCTGEFAVTTQAWIQQWDANRVELAALLGEQAVAERQAERRAQLRAIQEGLLARSLYMAGRRSGWSVLSAQHRHRIHSHRL